MPVKHSGVDLVPGALMVPTVIDVVVSLANKETLLAATAYDTRIPSESRNAIYRSTDGGDSWDLVHQFQCPGAPGVGQIVSARDNPDLLFAAGGCAIAKSTNGGLTWVDKPIAGVAWHVAIAPPEGGIRRVYAAGDGQIWYSENGGNSWLRDNAAVIPNMGKFQGIPYGTVGSFPFGGHGN